MAAGKRPAAGHGTDQEPEISCCKRRRVRIGSTAAFEFDDTPCLGEGSFGAVLKARHRVTGKTVAIKVLRCSGDLVTANKEIQDEAGFLEACTPNTYVVGSHGLFRDPETYNLCLAMDYVGPNLHAFLSERPPLPEAIVKAYMWQLLTGANKMHNHRILHRDIKPHNILVGEGGKILKLCDLGLAMSLKNARKPYEFAGTMPYMAPEMLLGRPDYDAGVDVWSLGCVMAEMLTGRMLFKADKKDDRAAQLSAIFRVLGFPDESTWPDFVAAEVPRVFFSAQAQQHNTNTLGNLFPRETLSQDGFQVLKGLLECNPARRLTTAAALQLPWFEPKLPTPTDDVSKSLPPVRNVMRIKIVSAGTLKKKTVLRIKFTPPATPKKNLGRIKIIPPATPGTKENLLQRIKVIPPATPQMKNVLRIPLAMWNKAM
ncbi:putative cyclin-dependent kinase F-2 [Triticum dicoccoides]|uniref:[RNA-polymerase]-subunit kinase n=1 Tax=Triticum aestivum TaxID=4565 RepID=A0A3B6IWB6_WHEAT|nr:putative cyclin-dependent kinase F-2 [Triticum dicoccoides]XP_044372840.1 putative cyclin-dependent kinase F-2 [Triticum aestivum]